MMVGPAVGMGNNPWSLHPGLRFPDFVLNAHGGINKLE